MDGFYKLPSCWGPYEPLARHCGTRHFPAKAGIQEQPINRVFLNFYQLEQACRIDIVPICANRILIVSTQQIAVACLEN